MRKLAIGITAAALSLAVAAPASAQGFWFGGPGIGVGVGFGPTYAYDSYPAYGYASVGYWDGEPAWGDTYASYAFEDDSYAYAPAVSVGYRYGPAYRHRTSTARYAYPERVSYRRSYAEPERVSTRQSYAYAPRASSRQVVYESGRRSGLRQNVAIGSRTAARSRSDVAIGSRTAARSQSVGSRVSSETTGSGASSDRVRVRDGQSMTRGSRSEMERGSTTRDLR